MKIQPSSAIENGLIAQLTTSVTPMPRDVPANLVQPAEVHLDQHRDDHDPDQEPDRQVDARELAGPRSRRTALGESWPRPMPAPMQASTQNVR